jgi:hypothetical protein
LAAGVGARSCTFSAASNCLATNWHLEVIAAKLTEVREGRIRRLIINIPYLSDFTFIIFHPTCRRRSNSA